MRELLRLWLDWWSGQQLGGRQLWGTDVFWLGRVGKGLQFVAGAISIAEVIGANRFRRWAEGVSSPDWRSSWRLLNAVVEKVRANRGLLVVIVVVGMLLAGLPYAWIRQPEGAAWLARGWVVPMLAVWILGIVSFRKFVHMMTHPDKRGQDKWAVWGSAVVLGQLFGLAVLTLALIWTIVAVASFVRVGVGRALAFVLERVTRKFVYLVAFVIFTIGFHFDLLAS